jgi:tRNA(fMet)-specific endonuclease VapC
MTVAELDRWALERIWGDVRRARMEQHLRNFVVYPFDRSLCLRWAEAVDSARRNGRPIGVADAWIAATALEHDIPLITNNAGHYAGVEGLTVVAEISQPE